ncbi:MAG TPA: MBL fold metallo-hydrolase [Solirubrobacteraceae bacterium]|nr:MBL fold metallo-hydrolase [Solirubrobacteraceae bacterium]
MRGNVVTLTYLGGPTALLEWRGVRLLTDPTFDPAGTRYELPVYTLRKTQGPALASAAVGHVDAVLLSHDHHFDNLDHAGRAVLGTAGRVVTTVEGAERLGGRSEGLAPWQQATLAAGDGGRLSIVATPARHGPAHPDRGPVVGFALAFADEPGSVVYVSGDTVWYEGVAEVARRFEPQLALLNLGAARVSAVGASPLTFTAAEAVEAARAMPAASIVPLHFEGWEHFTESRADVEAAFRTARLAERLLWPQRGKPLQLDLLHASS